MWPVGGSLMIPTHLSKKKEKGEDCFGRAFYGDSGQGGILQCILQGANI